MAVSKKLFSIILLVFLFCFVVNAETFNNQGDFAVTIDSLKNQVYNDNIQTSYNLIIENNKNFKQNFDLVLNKMDGWDINVNPDSFSLNSGETQEIEINLKANSEFNYGTNVRSPDTIKISQNNNYIGSFDFPLEIIGDIENVSLNLKLDIKAKEKNNEVYFVEFSTKDISPEEPLNFAIKGTNIVESQNVEITLNFAGEIFTFEDTFSQENNYNIYEQKIPATINPGTYKTKIIVRLEKNQNDVAWEWDGTKDITVKKFEKIDEKIDEKKSFFKDKGTIEVINLGNTKVKYNKTINSNFLKNIFLSSNVETTSLNGDIILITDLDKGETKTIEYSYNYIPLYLLIIIIIVLSTYLFIRKNSNPLDVEVNLYEIKKVKYEGVKQVKIKIGFENIKENEIDNLSIIFRMPKYLNVKDNSFLLSQPNNVLKGRNQYKLTWNFKRFEKDESRILGFTLVNARGILGDIKIPDLEIEIKNNGKIKKYHKSVPVIRG